MILFDLDPNVVKPGWIPLLITIGLALVMVLLYRSMRRQFRRVETNFPLAGPSAPSATGRPELTDDAVEPDAPVGHGGEGSAPRR